MKVILQCIMLLMLSTSIFAQELITGTYAIKNVETGMVLRIKDANSKDGTPIVAYSPVNWKCVTWDFKHVDGQTYQLKNLFSGKSLQPSLEKPTDGDKLIEKPLTEAEVQQHEFIPAGQGIYLIKMKGKDLYITPSDANGTENAATILTKKKDGKLQQWTIIEQHPTM